MNYDRRNAAVDDPWIPLEKVAEICPSCAERMEKIGLRAIRASILRQAAWENLPKGWTKESLKKFWESLTGDVKHKVTKCIKKMEGSGMDDPGAFCASLADKITGRTDWRGED